MSRYISGEFNRTQIGLYLNNMMTRLQKTIQVIDAFIDSLDMVKSTKKLEKRRVFLFTI